MTNQPRLLVVEDDLRIAEQVAQEAENLGYSTSNVVTVEAAKRETAAQMPQLVILDRMLADDSDGLEYIRWLNSLEGERPGILVASRLTSTSDHVTGLELGADDYINKPFEIDELRARIKAISRRTISRRAPSTVLFFGSLELRVSSKQAFIGDIQLDLQPLSFRLLQALTERHGEWVSRDALWREVWTDYQGLPPQDSVINSAISKVRRVLKPLDGAPSIVSEKLGYRLTE